jgi:hypothetical protein
MGKKTAMSSEIGPDTVYQVRKRITQKPWITADCPIVFLLKRLLIGKQEMLLSDPLSFRGALS